MVGIFGELLVGFGLFLLGLTFLVDNLKKIGMARFRALVPRFASSRLRALLFGIVSGAVMQSASAALAILASLNTVGLISVAQALPIISGFNLGVTVLVFLSTFDIHLPVLYLAGFSGIALHFTKKDGPRSFWAILFGLGLIFFSISMLKSGAAPLAQTPWFSALLVSEYSSGIVAVLVGFVLGFLIQSSTVIAMLSVSFVDAGALQLAQALPIIYGAALGSNLFRVVLGISFKGTARQLVRFQNLINFVGAGIFIVLYFIEKDLNVPLVISLIKLCSGRTDVQVFLAFLFLTITAVALLTVVHTPLTAWLQRSLPATFEQDLAQPKYIADLQTDDPKSALELVSREQQREMEQVCAFGEPLRENYAGPDINVRHRSFLELGEQVQHACDSLTCLELSPALAMQLGEIRSDQAILAQLADSAYETFCAAQQAMQSNSLKEIALTELESLEFLLISTKDAIISRNSADIEQQLKLCYDRGPAMRELRRSYMQKETILNSEEQTLLLDMTICFEKAVWLLRRLLQTVAEK